MIAFIDFEASSLSEQSYPIEVGWVLEDGTGESYLIRPRPRWRDWSTEAEQVHGISREQLAVEGMEAADVARQMAAALRRHTLYSDAAAQDSWWAARLMASGGLDPVDVRDVSEAYLSACGPLVRRLHPSAAASIAAHLLRKADAEAYAAHPREHRAGDDARRLWFTWKRLRELVAQERG